MKFAAVCAAIKKDAMRLNDMAPGRPVLSGWRLVSLMLRTELLAILIYRVAHWFYTHKLYFFAQVFYRLNLIITGADIHPRSSIGTGCLLVHTIGFVFDGTIGTHATIFGHCVVQPSFDGQRWSAGPVIGDRCTLCLQSTVLGDVRIADDVTLAPFTLVSETIAEPGVTVSNHAEPLPLKMYQRSSKSHDATQK